jgi:protein-L-isoaspartate O-methyltransferase
VKFTLLLSVLLILPVSVPAQEPVKRDEHQMHRLHRDPKAYIGALEDPQRDAYQKPQEVMNALRLKPGELIADIGAGSGYFTFRLAHHVGDKGKVYAVDVSPDMILHINRRIRELKVNNVVSILADPGDPLLSDASVNRFFSPTPGITLKTRGNTFR